MVALSHFCQNGLEVHKCIAPRHVMTRSLRCESMHRPWHQLIASDSIHVASESHLSSRIIVLNLERRSSSPWNVFPVITPGRYSCPLLWGLVIPYQHRHVIWSSWGQPTLFYSISLRYAQSRTVYAWLFYVYGNETRCTRTSKRSSSERSTHFL